MIVEIVRDTLGVVAFASVVTGCSWLHPAAGCIVGGGLVLAALIFLGKGKQDDT